MTCAVMGETTDHRDSLAVGWRYENPFLRLLSKELDRELDRSCLSAYASLLSNRQVSSPWFIFLVQFQGVRFFRKRMILWFSALKIDDKLKAYYVLVASSSDIEKKCHAFEEIGGCLMFTVSRVIFGVITTTHRPTRTGKQAHVSFNAYVCAQPVYTRLQMIEMMMMMMMIII
jgi:hypothetical protein